MDRPRGRFQAGTLIIGPDDPVYVVEHHHKLARFHMHVRPYSGGPESLPTVRQGFLLFQFLCYLLYVFYRHFG